MIVVGSYWEIALLPKAVIQDYTLSQGKSTKADTSRSSRKG